MRVIRQSTGVGRKTFPQPPASADPLQVEQASAVASEQLGEQGPGRGATSGDEGSSAPTPAVMNELVGLLYEDLRRLAAAQLRAEPDECTLHPTALVHEAYLRLASQRGGLAGDNDRGVRAQFIALASTMMRRILVDHARARHARKRGCAHGRIALHDLTHEGLPAPDQPPLDLLAVDEALTRLSLISPHQARLVELRFFGGLTIEQTASVVGSAPRSVDRDLACAKAWLRRELDGGRP